MGIDSAPVSTVLAANGRSVSATMSSSTRPDPADFDVVLGGQVLDQVRQPQDSSTEVPVVAPRGVKELLADPGTPGQHATQAHDYTLRARKLPDIPLRAEMVGHVVEPTDATNQSPLVLFLHGRHSACYRPKPGARSSRPTALSRAGASAPVGAWKCPGKQIPIPSYLGYDYAQRLLASQGYTTVSISADAINDLDYHAVDGGAGARAALIEDHLDAWTRMVTRGTEHADLGNVVLVGHSRGGEGANRASVDIPEGAPYAITGQVLIGPTDFGFQSAPYIPTLTILPYCDGDVSDLQGQNFTDDGRDLTDGPQALHSSILVMGADHNFFNSEWTPGISAAPSNDDWFGDPDRTCGTNTDARLTPLGQRKVGKSYIAAAVALFARDDQSVLPLFDGAQVSLPSADNADVRSHAIGGGMDIRRPRLDTTLSTPTGATTRFCAGQSESRRAAVCEPRVPSVRTPHWPGAYFAGVPLRPEFEMRWTAAGQVGGMTLNEPWDLSTDSTLLIRTIVDPSPPVRPANLKVILTDSQGDSVTLGHLGSQLRALPGGDYLLSKRWAQTLQVPLAHPGAVDLTDITQVDLLSVNRTGHIWVVDMSAEPSAGLAVKPPGSLPSISFGKVTQPEGDGPGTATVDVPYVVTGTLNQDATLTILTSGGFGDERRGPQVTIPAHTTHGSFPLTYQPNTLHDQARRQFLITAYAVHGIQTDRYLGRATIIDDDPAPHFKVTVDDRRIVEGETGRWNVALSAPMGIYSFVQAVPVRAGVEGPQLTVGDLPKKFRKRHFFPIPPIDTPLFKTDLNLFRELRPGRTTVHLKLPTLLDRHQEGARSITFRFRTYGIPLEREDRTVVVTDPR